MSRRFTPIVLTLMVALAGASPSKAQIEGLSGWNIYLDPGHSRTENQGIFGYSEAEKNVRVALALQDILLARTDIDTVYISRTNDQQNVSLTQRSDHANSLGAAWFHSIHSDAGSPTTNSTLMLWGQLSNGQEKTPNGGKALSDIMSPLLTRGMRTTTRGSIGDCSFYMSFQSGACSGGGPYLSVNRRTTMPSELSEAGFHTNPTQNQRNMNDSWKRLEAWTFYWSILEFHGIERPPVSHLTGIVTDAETGGPINGAEITVGGRSYTTDTYESLFNRYSSDPNQLANGFYYFEDLDAAPGKRSIIVNANADRYQTYLADVDLVDSFFTFLDVNLVPAIPPAVASTTPDSGGTIRIIDPITVSFTRPMDRAVTEAAVQFDPPLDGTFTWTSDFGFTFRPDEVQPTTDYTMTIGESAVGRLGDPFDGDGDEVSGGVFTLSFRTGFPDFIAPRVLASEPGQRSIGVDRNPIPSLTFDEVIDSSSISEEMVSLEVTSDGTPVPGRFEHYVLGGRSVPSFFPEQTLEPQTLYRFTLEAGATDIFGNALDSPRNLFFTTGSEEYDRKAIDAFEGGVGGWWVPQQSETTTGILPENNDRSVDSSVVNHVTGSLASMRLDYAWDTTAGDWIVRLFLSGSEQQSVQFDSTWQVEAHVFGDGSGTLFRFALDDRVPTAAASNHEVSPWYPIDWRGWRLLSWNAGRDGVGSWLGDGSLDGRLRFDSIQLSYAGSGAADGGTIFIDDLRIAKSTGSPVAVEENEIPGEFRLSQTFPNPFSQETTLGVELPSRAAVTFEVFDATGARVEVVLESTTLPAGSHQIKWTPAESVPAGVYFARVRAGRWSQTVRMVRLR